MVKGFLNLPWFLWGVLSLVISIVWIYVGPHTKMEIVPGFRFFIIRWGHALTWFLLAINFFLRGINPNLSGLANIIAMLGGLIYILFIIMKFVVK